MNRKINWEDVAVGVVIIIIGAVLFISSLNLPGGNSLTQGADFMPKVISGLLTILGVCFVLSALIKRTEAPTNHMLNKTEAIRFGISVLFLFLYIFFLKKIGFIIMTFLYICAQSWFITPKEKRKPVFLVIMSAVVSVAVYFLFVYGLKLMLPAGILG